VGNAQHLTATGGCGRSVGSPPHAGSHYARYLAQPSTSTPSTGHSLSTNTSTLVPRKSGRDGKGRAERVRSYRRNRPSTERRGSRAGRRLHPETVGEGPLIVETRVILAITVTAITTAEILKNSLSVGRQ